MGQKVNPVGFRTGVMIGWKSRWYASKQDFSELLLEDQKVRKFIKKHPTRTQYRQAGIDKIEVERTRDEVKVVLHCARPGLIIGKKGQEIESLQGELQALIGRRVNVKIQEISKPELQAQLVAEEIAEQLQKRSSFRRTMKRAMEQTMDAGAKGIKVQLAGRLGGAEMARREKQISGSIPLSTLRAKIDWGFCEAMTAQGHIGVQVWVNQGFYSASGEEEEEQEGTPKPKRRRSFKQ